MAHYPNLNIRNGPRVSRYQERKNVEFNKAVDGLVGLGVPLMYLAFLVLIIYAGITL